MSHEANVTWTTHEWILFGVSLCALFVAAFRRFGLETSIHGTLGGWLFALGLVVLLATVRTRSYRERIVHFAIFLALVVGSMVMK